MYPLRKSFIILYALTAVLKAQIARYTGRQTLLGLPPAKNCAKRAAQQIEILRLIAIADACVKLLAWNTSQPCLFQSYVRAVVLRHGGILVDLNIGLRNMGSASVYGHCWLTLDGVPYFESEAVDEVYPFFFGKSTTGINYWGGPIDTEDMVRKKKEGY
jgi:hypothetical protein